MITALHNSAFLPLTKPKTVVANAHDNLIKKRSNWLYWGIDAGSLILTSGVKLVRSANNYASIDINYANTGEGYWLKVWITGRSTNQGNIQIGPVGYQGCAWGDITGGVVTTSGNVTGIRHVKIYASGAAPHKLVISNQSASDGEYAVLTDMRVFPKPVFAEKIFVWGDTWSSWDGALSSGVQKAITGAGAKWVIQDGDSGDSTNTDYSGLCGWIRSGVESRGGAVYPCCGNHDTASAACLTNWSGFYHLPDTYYRTSGALRNIEIFVYDTNARAGINDTTSVAAAQAALMGRWLGSGIKNCTKPWKILVHHQPEYSSYNSLQTAMRWNWSATGVHLIFCGHNHGTERLVDGNVTFFTIAMGGTSAFHGFNQNETRSVYRNGHTTIGKIYDTTEALVVELLTTGMDLLDRTKIAKI